MQIFKQHIFCSYLPIWFSLLLTLLFPFTAHTQNNNLFDLTFDIVEIQAPRSISHKALATLEDVSDLSSFYNTSWIKSYEEISVKTFVDGEWVTKNTFDKKFSTKQLLLFDKMDITKSAFIKIKYIPENTLSQNDVQEINFQFSIAPHKKAGFDGGEQALDKFILNGEKLISPSEFKQDQLTIIKFTVTQKGEIGKVNILESSGDISIDKILVNYIRSSPKWQPALYNNDLPTETDFALLVGDIKSCSANQIKFNIN